MDMFTLWVGAMLGAGFVVAVAAVGLAVSEWLDRRAERLADVDTVGTAGWELITMPGQHFR